MFTKNKKELETLIHAVRIYNQDIGMEFGVEKIRHEREMTHDENGTTKSRKIRLLGEKETYKYLGI